MKKLRMLIILLMLSCSSFSQTDTTAVSLNKPTAKAVIKDLISGDFCKAELIETRNALLLTEKKVEVQFSIINNLEEQKLLLSDVIHNKTIQITAQEKAISSQTKVLRRERGVSTIYKIGTILGILTSGYLLMSK